MKKIVLVVLLASVFVSTSAFAKMGAQKSFKAAYPTFAGTVSCALCHEPDKKLNGYGVDLGAHNLDFAAIEALDSDGDGATNIAEINAGTLPGDKTSTPVQD